MLTQSIINAKNAFIGAPRVVGDCVALILNKMDHRKYSQIIESAITHPHRSYTIVLFEYTHSGINDTIAHIERMPGTTKSIHDILSDTRCLTRLNELFIVNSGMRLFTRRKIDHTKPFGHEQVTKIRQVVVAIDPYAFGRPRSQSEDSCGDMPPLIPLNNYS